MTNNEFIESTRIPGEIWKDVVGYEGKYMVSSIGRVLSLSFPITAGKLHYCRKPHLLTLKVEKNGYVSVALSVGQNKTIHHKVHRLVAAAFLDNPKNLPCVNHKDENKINNSVDNLEWASWKYNIRYGTGIQRRASSLKSSHKNCKKVAKLDNAGQIIQTYPGLQYAANEIRRDYSAITFAIKHNSKCAGSYWKFI